MEEMQCVFCDESYGAYLMYRHFAVAHCDKIKEVLQVMKSIPLFKELDFKTLYDCITVLSESGYELNSKEKKVMKQLQKIQEILI